MTEHESSPAFHETHVSWVLLSGDTAYKIPKPVRTDVLDQSDRALRRAACAREVALNRRLAPDVYRGVGSICLDGEELEPVVVMDRMPADRRLADLLSRSSAPVHIRSVARAVASFHASEPALDVARARSVASPEAVLRRWAEDVEGMRALRPDADALIDSISTLARQYVTGRTSLFERRIDHGFVRDGHGDLLCDDIFCLEDGPRILDCLAFSDDLRHGDVLADIAFLVMDLQRLGHPDLARQLLRDYCEFGDEHHPGSLAHFWVAQRALVRAKVSALRDRQRRQTSLEVRELLRLALDHLRRATVRIVLVGGLPGSGKSTAAGRLADETGWPVLSSDEIRRDLCLRTQDGTPDGGYGEDAVAAVYAEMRERARRLAGAGHSVILDATWTSAAERAAAREVAKTMTAELVELRCEAPVEQCRRRVASRSDTRGSEATPEVVDRVAARADAWPEATSLRTGDVDQTMVVDALTLFEELWWSAAPPTVT